ncbi:cold-shock protein [Halobium palmae]|uniref:Cold-shock protein n=1 Tax=Halobium palmae TaxID=1776492 RepID=A0ABD5RVF1_9EURY
MSKKTGVTGWVRTYNAKKGYGFIIGSGVSENVFVHISEVDGLNGLTEGHQLTFDAVKGDKGWKAVNARKTPGSRVDVAAVRRGGRGQPSNDGTTKPKRRKPRREKRASDTITGKKKKPESENVPEKKVSARETSSGANKRKESKGGFKWKGDRLVRRKDGK